MSKMFAIISKLIKKAIAVVLLTGLLIAYYAFHILFFVVRLLAVPFAIIGTVMTFVDGYLDGFTFQGLCDLVFLWFVVAVRFLLPLMVPVVQRWRKELQGCILAPLYIRPRVRYTI